MLVEEIKKRVVAAVKQGDLVTRDVLRLALGEIQTAEARKNAVLSEEDAAAALREFDSSRRRRRSQRFPPATNALRRSSARSRSRPCFRRR